MSADSLATFAALVGDPARARMLVALFDRVEMPATDLARHGAVSAQTTSFHLRKLCEAGVLTVARRGRSRVYALAGAHVASALEAMLALAPRSNARSLRDRLKPIELARTCYDHLAGRLGVALADAMEQQGWIETSDRQYVVTAKGESAFSALALDLERLRDERRQFAKRCLDWTERRYHVAGALGAAIANELKRRKWIVPLPNSRTVQITSDGYSGLRRTFRVAL